MQATLQEYRDCHRVVLNQCEDDLIAVGMLDPAAVTRRAHRGDSSSDEGERTAEAPDRSPEAEGACAQEVDPSMEDMPGLQDVGDEEMEVGSEHSGHSSVRDEEDDLLDDSNRTAAQFQDAERDAPPRVGPAETLTGGETLSTGVTAGISGLSVSSPEASSHSLAPPEDSATDTAPPVVE